jgi:putative ABC transport system ATP-binding protein
VAATSDRDLAIHCRNLTKTYGSGPTQVAALRGIDLEVRSGELFMLVGPSGCGKTTLISILSAILSQDEGHCSVLGLDLTNLAAREKARFRNATIGFVFQAFNLLPALTAVDNVSVPLLIQGLSRKAASHRARAMLEAVGLAQRSHALPGQLSGGQQQRVAIARALVHEPQLIVCDEPTSSLDHHAGQEMMALLQGLAQHAHSTVLIVTHDERILGFADRVAHMDDGRIVAIGDGEARP